MRKRESEKSEISAANLEKLEDSLALWSSFNNNNKKKQSEIKSFVLTVPYHLSQKLLILYIQNNDSITTPAPWATTL